MSDEEKTTIQQVNSYFEKIYDYYDELKDGEELVFRGHADKAWKSIPGIFRDLDKNDFQQEHSILNETIFRMPTEFSGSHFEKLAKMQHYGLRTRLIDVTFNPLVGLFFAVNAFDGYKDGEVLIAKVKSVYEYDYSAKVSAGLAFIDLNKSVNLKYIQSELKKIGLGDNEDKEKLKEILNNKNPICVRTIYNNDRIKKQSGAFLIAPCVESLSNGTYQKQASDYSSAFSMPSITIQRGYKKKILDFLSKMGVNEPSLFPELEYQLRHMNEKLHK